MKTEWTNRRIATATITILIVIALAAAVYQIRDTLILVFVGIVFALAVRGPVDMLHKYLRLPRGVAILLVLLVALAILPILVFSLVPALVGSIQAVLPVAADGYAQLPNASDYLSRPNSASTPCSPRRRTTWPPTAARS